MGAHAGLIVNVSLLALGLGALGLRQYQSVHNGLGSTQGCSAYTGLPEGWPANPLPAMQQIKGGEFTPGSRNGNLDERPLGAVTVGDFWIDRTESRVVRSSVPPITACAIGLRPANGRRATWPPSLWAFVLFAASALSRSRHNGHFRSEQGACHESILFRDSVAVGAGCFQPGTGDIGR